MILSTTFISKQEETLNSCQYEIDRDRSLNIVITRKWLELASRLRSVNFDSLYRALPEEKVYGFNMRQ